MRTTLTIGDELLKAAKRRARRRGQSLGELVETALQRELALADEPAERVPVPVFTGGGGPRPGVDLSSNRVLHEQLDETLDLNSLR